MKTAAELSGARFIAYRCFRRSRCSRGCSCPCRAMTCRVGSVSSCIGGVGLRGLERGKLRVAAQVYAAVLAIAGGDAVYRSRCSWRALRWRYSCRMRTRSSGAGHIPATLLQRGCDAKTPGAGGENLHRRWRRRAEPLVVRLASAARAVTTGGTEVVNGVTVAVAMML